MTIARFFPEMLMEFVNDNFTIPEDVNADYKKEDYPHWVVFQNIHLGQAFDESIMEHHAEIIGSMTKEEIMVATPEDLEAKGICLQGNDYWD